MAIILAASLFALSSVSGTAPNAQNLCMVNFGNSSYDLSALSIPSFYPVKDSRKQISNNYTYFINICANVGYLNRGSCQVTYPGPGTSLPVNNGTASPAYQYFEPGYGQPRDRCHRLGGPVSTSTVSYSLYDPTNPSKGLSIQYTGGDQCGSNTLVNRSLKLWVLCYNDAANILDDEVVLTSTSNPCSFEIFLKSSYGCPSSCPMPNKQICNNHGVCDFDSIQNQPRCFCNPGYEGDDCTDVTPPPTTVLSTGSAAMVAIILILTAILGFLGYLWYFKISKLRLDTTAYKSLAAGPGGASAIDSGAIDSSEIAPAAYSLPPAPKEGSLN